MKIQCDVCGREEASVFCCADEAALCAACDRRVHRANKLAGKHRRFSLILPFTASSSSSSSSPSAQPHPICDICQEKRGFMFCQEDRAILCKDCDGPIHTANDLTMKHSRFLLTGARFSPVPIPIPSSSSPQPEPEEPEHSANNSTASALTTNQDQAPLAGEPVICSSTTATSAAATNHHSGSSISDYLIKMLPGCLVEDLLVDDAAAAAAAADGIRKTGELLPFLDADLEGGGPGATAEEFPVWVPHVPQIPPMDHPAAAAFSGAGVLYSQGFRMKQVNHPNRWSDDAFTVPQILPAAGNNKRPRSSLWNF